MKMRIQNSSSNSQPNAVSAILPSGGKLCSRLITLAERVLRFRRHEPKRLRLAETLSLGERRFIALIEVDRSRILVGGTSTSLALLAKLDDRNDGFSEAVGSAGKLAAVAGAR